MTGFAELLSTNWSVAAVNRLLKKIDRGPRPDPSCMTLLMIYQSNVRKCWGGWKSENGFVPDKVLPDLLSFHENWCTDNNFKISLANFRVSEWVEFNAPLDTI